MLLSVEESFIEIVDTSLSASLLLVFGFAG